MGRRIRTYLLTALVFGAFAFMTEFAFTKDYVETTARVTDIEQRCFMQKTKKGLIDETHIDSKGGSCRAAKSAIETDPKYKDYELIKWNNVEYKYVSPADGGTYRGRHTQTTHADGRPIRHGDELVILAHKSRPKETMED